MNKESYFDIHTLEYIKKYRPAQHQQVYELLWLKGGTGTVQTKQGKLEVQAGHVYCFRPQQLISISAVSQLEGYYISVSPDIFYSIPHHNLHKTGIVVMNEPIQQETETLLVSMQKEFTNHFSFRLEILQELFRLLVLYLSRDLVKKTIPLKYTRDAVIADNFLCLLTSHVTTKKMVADYARELNVTPSYLNRVVKKVSGFTASYHIQQQVVQEAKRRAMNINCSMKEIAYDLGFDDTAHFSKFFKNNSGVNFTHYKKESLIARI